MIHGLDKLTSSAGVYIFKGKENKILYIGKASNLKNRVSSYFQPSTQLSPRIAEMVNQVAGITLKETAGEIPALILESQLIKKHLPPFNTKIKDDKSSYFIVIDYNYEFPRVKLSRTVNNSSQKAFGPYPETNLIWSLKTIRRAFGWADCGSAKIARFKKLNRPCLYGDVNLCPAPCINKISAKDYKKNLVLLEKFLAGKYLTLIKQLKKQMIQASSEQDYERALLYRDQLTRLERVLSAKTSLVDNSPILDEDLLAQEALESLSKTLKKAGVDLPKDWSAERIEAYDISNLQGDQAVGSMVVFTQGIANKSEYRRFRIRGIKGPNDAAMIAQVVTRRLNRWPHIKPNLLLIDGGKPQLKAVKEAMAKVNIFYPLVSLAKREELLIIPIKKGYNIIKLPGDSSALRLLQQVRDQSHYFALSYHRLLRSKTI